MKPSLRQQLERLALRVQELDALLADPQLASDRTRYRSVAREQAQATSVVALYRSLQKRERDLAQSRELLSDPEMVELAKEEAAAAQADIERLQGQLQTALLPRDPDDERNVFLEIRAGTGGEESALFAADLARMYLRYAERRGWRSEVMSESASDLGGYKEIVVRLEGDSVYERMKFESGGHRVQRVPATEASGRIHTSTATVAVLPEADEIDIQINEKDLRIDTFCSSGPGGQSVNTTYSAVRVTHIPTGIVVSQQDEKSQIKNRAKALNVLRSRLYDLEMQKQQEAIAKERRGQVGSGDRSEKIRTYNFPQSRITDHRINFTTHQLTSVLDGNVGELIDALTTYYTAEKLKEVTAVETGL
jgi:peptide chain release factor 1